MEFANEITEDDGGSYVRQLLPCAQLMRNAAGRLANDKISEATILVVPPPPPLAALHIFWDILEGRLE